MTKKQPCRISPTGLLLFSHFNLRPIPKQKHQTPIMEHGEIFQNGIPDGFIKCFQHGGENFDALNAKYEELSAKLDAEETAESDRKRRIAKMQKILLMLKKTDSVLDVIF